MATGKPQEPFEIFMHRTIAKTLLDRGIITLDRYTAIITKLNNNYNIKETQK